MTKAFVLKVEGTRACSSNTKKQQAVLACSNACLQQRLLACSTACSSSSCSNSSTCRISTEYAARLLTFAATTPCSRLNLGRFCGAETALLAGLWWLWRCDEGDYRMPHRFASSVDMGPCQNGPCQPARFCKKSLLLLLHASSAACCCCCCTRVHTRCRWCTRAYRQPEATLAQAGKKSAWFTPLSGQAWRMENVRRVVGQQNAAVESHITHIWLYHNMLPTYD